MLPTGNFHVDFYGQLQTHQETGRQVLKKKYQGKESVVSVFVCDILIPCAQGILIGELSTSQSFPNRLFWQLH